MWNRTWWVQAKNSFGVQISWGTVFFGLSIYLETWWMFPNKRARVFLSAQHPPVIVYIVVLCSLCCSKHILAVWGSSRLWYVSPYWRALLPTGESRLALQDCWELAFSMCCVGLLANNMLDHYALHPQYLVVSIGSAVLGLFGTWLSKHLSFGTSQN